MAWFELLQEIEPFEDLTFDRSLVDALESAARAQPLGPLRFYTPTFRSYASEELKGCGKASFPAFSITGGACALNCDHCQAKILEPMIPATKPDELAVERPPAGGGLFVLVAAPAVQRLAVEHKREAFGLFSGAQRGHLRVHISTQQNEGGEDQDLHGGGL